jgi:membrane dipeptidase
VLHPRDPRLPGGRRVRRVRGEPARADEWRRAIWQIERLEQACLASGGRVGLARWRGDLERLEREGAIAAVLGVEGAHALGGDPGRVEALWRRGVRFMSLNHLSNNELAGSSFPLSRERGLSGLGREVLAEMARVGMAVDLAHASRTAIGEILAGPRLPVFCSHTGLGSVTPRWRNLDDATVREVAARGGVVCVIFATAFLGGGRLEHLVRHIERALEVAGEDAVGLGSDYDGFIRLPRPMRDVRDVPLLARALLGRGHAPATIRKVLGENLRRFLAAVMPAA